MKKFFLIGTILISSIQADAATVRYVKLNGTGDGSSWDNASGNIQAMVNASDVGDQVWVATGTYTTGLNIKEGVNVYGSFAGTETEIAQREKSDTDGNGKIEPWEFTHVTNINGVYNYFTYSYSQLLVQENDFTIETVCDGLMLINGGGINNGPVIIRKNGKLENCLISGNRGGTAGAVYSADGVLSGCMIRANRGFVLTQYSGNVLVNSLGISGTNCSLIDCVIDDNNYGGISVSGDLELLSCEVKGNGYEGLKAANLKMTDCIVQNNGRSGIIAAEDVELTSCVIEENGYAGVNAANIKMTDCTVQNNIYGGVFAQGHLEITNCKVEGNRSMDGIRAETITMKNIKSVKNNGGWGINITNGDIDMTSCTVEGNGYGGVRADNIKLTDCSIKNNGANTNSYNNYAGVLAQGHLDITNCTVEENKLMDGIRAETITINEMNSVKNNGGWGINITNGDIELTSFMLEGNGYGGVFATNIKMTDCTITNNGAGLSWYNSNYGGVFAQGRLEITNCTVENNKFMDGIRGSETSIITMKDMNIIKNNDGWGINITNGDIDMTSCAVEGNGYGGISAENIKMTDCSVQNNGAGLTLYNNYGGVFAQGHLEITNCKVDENKFMDGIRAGTITINKMNAVKNNGGWGINITSGDIELTSFTLEGNVFGGVNSANNVKLTDCNINNNGLGISGATVTAINCTINQNSTSGIDGVTVTATYCTISQNAYRGIVANVLNMSGCTIDRNEGTGVYLSSSTETSRIYNNIVSNNRDGGFYIEGNNPHISNNLIVNNTRTGTYNGGGGLYLNSASPALYNNTIAYNDVASQGGAIYCIYGSSPVIINCILYGNTSNPDNAQIFIYESASAPKIVNCINQFNGIGIRTGVNPPVEYNWANYTDNLDVNPQFENFALQNYQLRATSVAIDIGVDTVGLRLPKTDLYGNPRISGERIDLGCYEYTTAIPSYTVSGSVLHDGTALAGVIVQYSGGSVTTDTQGKYSVTAPKNSTIIITPALAGYTFAPPSKTFENIVNDITHQDFYATAVNTTAAEELLALDLNIYPNPFTSEVHITGATLTRGHAPLLKIIDAAGSVVHSQIITTDDETIYLNPNSASI